MPREGEEVFGYEAGSTPVTGHWPLLQRLIDRMFAHIAQESPTALSVAKQQTGPGALHGALHVSHSWRRRDVASTSDLGKAVAEALAKGPVMLIPPVGKASSQFSRTPERPSRPRPQFLHVGPDPSYQERPQQVQVARPSLSRQ